MSPLSKSPLYQKPEHSAATICFYYKYFKDDTNWEQILMAHKFEKSELLNLRFYDVEFSKEINQSKYLWAFSVLQKAHNAIGPEVGRGEKNSVLTSPFSKTHLFFTLFW